MSQKFSLRNKRIEFTDPEIINGLQTDNAMIIRYLYKKYYPGIKSLVLSFHHLRLMPEDIFQEGITRVILNIRNGRFEGKSSFYTYFSAVCKNLCLKELKQMSHYDYNEDVNENLHESNDDMYDILPLMIGIKSRMDESCKQIIDLRFKMAGPGNEIPEAADSEHNMRFEVIAGILGIEAENARQRFKRCLEKLRNMLSADPRWVEYWKTV